MIRRDYWFMFVNFLGGDYFIMIVLWTLVYYRNVIVLSSTLLFVSCRVYYHNSAWSLIYDYKLFSADRIIAIRLDRWFMFINLRGRDYIIVIITWTLIYYCNGVCCHHRYLFSTESIIVIWRDSWFVIMNYLVQSALL